MAEILTPQEGQTPTPERLPETQSEQSQEQSPETQREGAQTGSGESPAHSAAPPAANYVPQQQDEVVHEELKASPQDQQVSKLKQMALQEGALKAVFHAKKLSDPYVIDELHDALVDELRNQLIEEGKVEQL